MKIDAIEKCINLAAKSPDDEIKNSVAPTAQGQLNALKELLGYVQRQERTLRYDTRHLVLEGRISRLKREMTQIADELESLIRESDCR